MNLTDNCPICESTSHKILLELDCGNMDGSTLYSKAKVRVCESCGHIYNELTQAEYSGLVRYYNEEYAPTNMISTDGVDRPGSDSPLSLARFAQLLSLVKSDLRPELSVLDVGCAMGGFLNYLKGNGLSKLFGIDFTEKFVSFAQKNTGGTIKYGDAEKIPFEDSQFDLVFEDQVLEHLVKPRKAFAEAHRVLKDGGLFCLGVPNAAGYESHYIFDFYWFIMREHIQHFDLEHIKKIAELEGFEFVRSTESDMPMMSPTMILPNLNVVFRKTDRPKPKSVEIHRGLSEKIEKYIRGEFSRLRERSTIMESLVKAQSPLYFWGIGREFLYLYQNTPIKNGRLMGLLDSNPYKQARNTVGGFKIIPSSALSKAPAGSKLIVTAVAHQAKIASAAQQMGFEGEVLCL